MTLTDKLQDPLAGIVAPAKVNVVPDGVADTVPGEQLVVAFAGLATTKPLGKLSVTPALVIAVAFGLVRVTVKTDTALAPTVDGTKLLATAGPLSALLTTDTVIAVPGPAPSGSIVAKLFTAPLLVAATLNCTVAVALTAITPAAWPVLRTRAAAANGITPPGPSATLTPLSFVLPAI